MAKRKAKNSKRRRVSSASKLRKDFENQILMRMLGRLESDAAQADELAKLMHAYCELRKQDIAAGKVDADDDSTAVSKAAAPTAHSVEELKRLVNAVYGLALSEPAPEGEVGDDTQV